MMIRKMLIVLVAGGCSVISALAQNTELPDPFKFLSAEQVLALTDQPGTGPKTAYVNRHDNYNIEFAIRTDASNIPEIHAHSAHYISILEGEGTLTYGGTVYGGKETAPGEMRGGSIQKGSDLALHQGDYVQIPAGVPHLIVASTGKTIHYILLNIRQ
jgi:quercetin dioxygenase-like cupin family protein